MINIETFGASIRFLLSNIFITRLADKILVHIDNVGVGVKYF